ncbi:MAG: stage V sporulation protein AB [Clostridiales bacterium]|nr:stage V sporulation protein AB [Clostridiales bacterium]
MQKTRRWKRFNPKLEGEKERMGQILVTVIGFSGGFLVAGGVVSVMVGLGIITRFIGLSHTARQILWYEDAILLGAVAGNVATVFDFRLVIGAWFLAVTGAFIGVFVGGWVMALAEVLDIFPVYSRRLGIRHGARWIVAALAAGKTAGSLLYFFRGLG